MSTLSKYSIDVSVVAQFLPEQSQPQAQRFAFAYTVTISNRGSVAAQLLSRHWVITDANGRVQEVRGPGVVGEQPTLQPGESFEYTSGAVLETSLGTMHGSYQMRAADDQAFEAPIARFTLSTPRTVH